MEFGAQVADPLHDTGDRRAHFDLEQPIVAAAFVEKPLGNGEARLVPGQRNAELGALQLEVGAQAQITHQNAAADRGDDHHRLHQMAEIDVGREMRVDHRSEPIRIGAGGVRPLVLRRFRHRWPQRVR